jgi:hypothetical protein
MCVAVALPPVAAAHQLLVFAPWEPWRARGNPPTRLVAEATSPVATANAVHLQVFSAPLLRLDGRALALRQLICATPWFHL